MLSLVDLNKTDRATFVGALGHLFEYSPWVAEQTWVKRLGRRSHGGASPFANAEDLHAELCRTMQSAPADRKLALIRAHPDLAGRLHGPEPVEGARRPKLTVESTREQASAGLDRLTDTELTEFQRLNNAYRARFGFPFIICARRNARDAILAAMKTRLLNSMAGEHTAALAEIERIAWLRLKDILRTETE